MRRPSVLIIAAAVVAALQIGFLAWTISTRASVLRDGREVVLKVEPIDPRDLLRGDYVTLGYEMSRLRAALFQPPPAADADSSPRSVWVALRKGDDNLFHPVKAAFDRSALTGLAADDVVVRGETSNWPGVGGDVFVQYGLERFYLPEGAGKQIEQDMRQRSFFVVAAVAADGAAQIKAFRDGETTLFEEPYY